MYLATGDTAFYNIAVGLRDYFARVGMSGGGWTLAGIRSAWFNDFSASD
jgi:hypothetical protein